MYFPPEHSPGKLHAVTHMQNLGNHIQNQSRKPHLLKAFNLKYLTTSWNELERHLSLHEGNFKRPMTSTFVKLLLFIEGQCSIKFPVGRAGSKEPMESRYQTNIKDELFI